MMYEGKNIHYSTADNKLLCSFSGKLCNQRRLNGYGFCVRHILEDQTAPFKRCAYVAKSSNQMCTQAIPKNEDRRYCNNHMQVLGMLPKKERKKKVPSVSSPESGLLLPNGGNTMKPKFSLSISKELTSRILQPSTSAGEPDDPYAFSDTASSDNKSGIGLISSLIGSGDSVLGKSLQTGTGFVRSASDISAYNAGLGISGGSMFAKHYPELAEKLEKKAEPKVSPKARTKSSRTMNKLQTKIAQNKINEKLRKSQELSLTDSNSSPLQVSSPEAGLIADRSPGSSPAFSPSVTNLNFSPQSTAGFYSTANTSLSGQEPSRRSPEMPPLPQVDTSLLATLASQDNMGFQTTEVECNVNPSSQILHHSHTPPRLPPPPYPGSSVLSHPSPLTPSDLSSVAFSPHTPHVGSVMDSLSLGLTSGQHQPVTTLAGRSSMSTSVSSLPFVPPLSEQKRLSKIATPLFLSPTSTNPVIAFSSVLSSGNVDHQHPTGEVKAISNNPLSTLDSSTNMDLFSLLSMNHHKPMLVETPPAQAGKQVQSPNTVAAQLSLPPPPPYVPPKLATSSLSSSSSTNLNVQLPPSSRVKHSIVNRPITTASVPHTKLRKLKGILNEKDALEKLKTESAMKYYSFYARKKISNHSLTGPYLCSSEEDSVDEDADRLPWQPDVFSASSDDQDDAEDDEFDTVVPMSMRPTKLSLMKTRCRRQWQQAQQAFRCNQDVARKCNQATLALIQTVRENGACAVRTLWHIKHIKKSKKKLRKMLPKKKKTCCHKSSTDGPCTNNCVPYTNHCLKHVMYNIDQQIFDYCTAKFADNTQCCMPVFDIRHELPLCPVHAAKADNYQKQMEAENKKKPRKKAKPAALTRPPRKGKKKKKGRYARNTKPMAAAETVGLDSTLSDVDVLGLDPPSQPEESGGDPKTSTANDTTTPAVGADHPAPSASSSSIDPIATSSATSSSSLNMPLTPSSMVSSLSSSSGGALLASEASSSSGVMKSKAAAMDQAALELEETLSPDFDKQFELPLEQASRLLEESDFQEVVNKMPFEALDLFGKHGEAEQEETDQIPLDQVSASKTRDAIEKLLCGTMSEEESMQLAMVLAQNLHTDPELAQNAMALLTEGEGGVGSVGTGMAGLDGRMNTNMSSAVLDANLGHLAGNVMDMQVEYGTAHGQSIVPVSSQQQLLGQQQQLMQQQHLPRQQPQPQHQSHDPHFRAPVVHHHPSGLSSSSASGTLAGAGLSGSAKLGQLSFDMANSPLKKQQAQHQQQQLQHNHVQQHLHQSSSISSPAPPNLNLSSTTSGTPPFHENSASTLSSSRVDHQNPTTGFSAVFGQNDSLQQTQLAAAAKQAMLQPLGPTQTYSKIAKTVIRHLPTETPPGMIASAIHQGGLRLAPGSDMFLAAADSNNLKLANVQMNSANKLRAKDSSASGVGFNARSSVEFSIQQQQDLRLDRTGNELMSNLILPSSLSSSSGFSPSSSSSLLSSPSLPLNVPHTTLNLALSSSSSSLSSSSSSLSLPSLAKKAKLMNNINQQSPASSSSVMKQELSNVNPQKLLQSSIDPSLHLKQLHQLQQQQQQSSSLQHQLLGSSSSLSSSSLSKGNILQSPAAMVGSLSRLSLDPSSKSSSPSPLPALLKASAGAVNTNSDPHRLTLPELQALKKRAGGEFGPLPHKQGSSPSNKLNKNPLPNPNSGTAKATAKLKLSAASKKTGLSDIMTHHPGATKLTLPLGSGSANNPSSLSSSSVTSSSSVLLLPQDPSSLYKTHGPAAATCKSSNTVRYTLTSSSNSIPPFAPPLQKSLLSDPLDSNSSSESPSESISVTVRHPSSLEAVPTTVRHTLPDTFPAHHSLPSSPLHFLPKSSSSAVASPTNSASSPSSASSSPHRLSLDSHNSTKQFSSTSSSSPAPPSSTSASSQQLAAAASDQPHSSLSSQLYSPRTSWVQTQPHHHQQQQQHHHLSGHTGLTNGISPPSFSKTHSGRSSSSNHELSLNKLVNPSALQNVMSPMNVDQPHQQAANKQHQPSSLLGVGGHVPVVCSSPVTLPGFALPLPAAAFKTSGTS